MSNPFNYTYNVNDPREFLQEVSEHYANVDFCKDASPSDILSYAERELSRIPNISTYINEVNEKTGESEMTFVFGWECTDDVELMADWFQLLRRLGGDCENHRNHKGQTAMEVARARIHRLGYTDEDLIEMMKS